MFLKKSKFKPYKYFRKVTSDNEEGVHTVSYKYEKDILAEIYPAGGKVQAEIYGDRLNYILNMNVSSECDIKENDAIAYMSDDVNYRIISIKNWTHHKQAELEKI